MTLTAMDIDRLLDEAETGDVAAQTEIEEIIVDLEKARARSQRQPTVSVSPQTRTSVN